MLLPLLVSVYLVVCLSVCLPVCVSLLSVIRQSKGAGVSFEGVLGFAGLPVHGRRWHEIPVSRASLPGGESKDHSRLL